MHINQEIQVELEKARKAVDSGKGLSFATIQENGPIVTVRITKNRVVDSMKTIFCKRNASNKRKFLNQIAINITQKENWSENDPPF